MTRQGYYIGRAIRQRYTMNRERVMNVAQREAGQRERELRLIRDASSKIIRNLLPATMNTTSSSIELKDCV